MKSFHDVKILFDIFRKGTAAYLPQKKLYRFLAALVLILILIPCIAVVGFFSYVMTEALIEVGNPGGGMLFEMQVLSAFSMVFGTWVIFSVLFFSSDREHLSTLPVLAVHLMSAKFLYSYIAESAMEFFVLLSVFGGYYLAVYRYADTAGITNPVSVIAALLGTFLLPLIPMIYCALFCLLLMALLKGIKNANTFFHATTVLTLLFGGLFVASVRNLGEVNIDNYLEVLGSGNDMFLRTLNIIFFPVPWLSKAVSEGSLIHLLLYLGANILLCLLFYLMGGALYQEGLYTAAALGSRQKKGIKESDLQPSPVLLSNIKKELRVLIRTKAFANNCVYVNLILPVCAFMLFHFMKEQGSMASFISLYQKNMGRARVTVMIVMIALGFIATAMNSVASTAFTREGAHLDLVKYIPVPYTTQILAKAATSFIITYPVLLVTCVIICIYLKPSLPLALLYAVMLLLSHIISLAMGMCLDSNSPYTIWDDEYSALRGNVNTFFNMGVVMLMTLVITFLSYMLYETLKAPIELYYAVLFMLFLAGACVSLIIGLGKRVYDNVDAL